MGFLKKLFGSQNPLERLRQSCQRKEWAAALNIAEDLEWDSVDPESRQAAEDLVREAGDRLAELNFEEGEYAVATGSPVRAREHLQLALNQVRSVPLRERIEQALATLDRGPATTDGNMSAAAGCGSECGPGCGPPAEKSATPDPAGLDEAGRLELYLGTLPPELADRYAAAGSEFHVAWLEAQEGNPQTALDLMERVPETKRNALFFSERGALRLRCNDPRGGEDDLKAALSEDPDLFPAFESLTVLLMSSGRNGEVETMARAAAAKGRFVGFSLGRLAGLYAERGDLAAALEAGSQALAAGDADLETLILCARILEGEGRYDEAEALFARLPAGGCGGGAHPMLAEFWLRREKNLDQALESFKGALRQERDNPRWALRIAQVYLVRGWRSEAEAQFDRLLARPDLPEEILSEAKKSMARLAKS